MKTYQILTVNLTKKGKKSGLRHVLIHTSEGTIVRKIKQFLNDLEGAFLLPKGVTAANADIDSAEVRRIMRDLTGGMAIGEVRFFNKGEQYEANENSTEVVEGRATAGQMLIHKENGAWIDGFLTLQVSDRADRNDRIADAHFRALNVLEGMTAPAGQPSNATRPSVDATDSEEDVTGAAAAVASPETTEAFDTGAERPSVEAEVETPVVTKAAAKRATA